MAEKRIAQIPLPGGSGLVPTGAMQFQDDWPGLFIRGDAAIALMVAINQLTERLADHPDVVGNLPLERLAQYAEIIARDVIVKGELHA